jgi:shikimate kinase
MKNLKEIREFIKEGVYDPGILKAFFLAGGPGSGKSFVTRNAFAGTGLKVVNSDNFFERGLRKANLSLSMPDDESYFRDIIRRKAKQTTSTALDQYVTGRLGLVIDGTARDYDAIARQHSMLNNMGYDSYMVFVNTSLDVALERNAKRERSVPEYITRKSHATVQSNMGRLQRLFGNRNFIVIDNSASEKELITQTLNKCNRTVASLLRSPINNYLGKNWIKRELEARKRT